MKQITKIHYHAMSLIILVYRNLIDIFFGESGEISIEKLPRNIGRYSHVKTLPKVWDQDTNIQGIYESSNGSRAFAKMITYRTKGIVYHKFKNEAFVYSILNKMKTQKYIKFPKLIAFIENKKSMIILLEFISGTSGDQMSTKQKLTAFKKYVSFVNISSKIFSPNNLDQLPRRSGIHFILMYPIFFVLALLRHPETYKELIKGFVVFITHSYVIFEKNELIFSHRDLHFKNFITKNGEAYLIDFDSAGFSLELYDAMITLWHEWGNDEFTTDLIAFLENRGMKYENYKKYFRVLNTYVCTQALTANNYSQEDIQQIRTFFKFGLQYGNSKNKNSYFFILRSIITNGLHILSKPFFINFTSVLCFHSISNMNDRYTINKNQFSKIIGKISKNSAFIDVESALNNNCIKSSVLITFDDGYKDIFDIVPLIQKYKIKPLLFVLTNPEKVNRSELDNNISLLNISEIKKLLRLGFDIGCHTKTHPDLTMISKKQLEAEINDAKKELEQKLGISIKYFAYPKGKYNDEIVKIVKRAGYLAAFTVEPGCISDHLDKFRLPRTIVDTTHQLDEFPAMYSPSTLLLRRLTNRFKLWERFLAI